MRWIYDKPLYRKPERGDPPAYLFSDAVISLGTTARFQRAVDAVKQGKANAIGALKDYFDTFTANLENFRLKENDTELDDQIIESINSFLPYRNEAVEILLDVARYQASQDAWDAIHGFLEKLLPYCFWPAGETVWGRWQSENLRFITHELFLYSVAALLKHERFEAVRQLTEQAYFMPVGSPEIDSGMIPFTCFRSYLRSLEHRNKRLNLGQFNLTADLLQKRAIIKELKYDDLMQADFILFLHEELRLGDERWIPDTLLYAERHRVFEVFARAESSNYFMKLRIALGVTQKAELEQLMQRYKTGDLKLPRWGFGSFDPARLMGIERIASTP